MSRFLISTREKPFEKIAKLFDSSFDRENTKELRGVFVSNWFKSSIKNAHSLVFADDFAFFSGTLEYKGFHGLDALKSIYVDFSEESFLSVLKKTSGCFSVVIFKKDKLFVFVDPLATFKSYYLDFDIGLSNNLFALGIGYSDHLSVNKMALIEQSFQYSVIGSETILKGVKKLQPGELYVCDEKLEFEVIDYNIFSEPADEVYEVPERLSKLSYGLFSNYGSISINMTGGLDSRLVLSSFLSSKSEPRLVYGRGNSRATNTKSHDEEIVNQFSSELNLDRYLMDWGLSNNFIDDWSSLLYKHGEYFTVYCGNQKLIDQYEKFLPSFSKYTCFGYFGETFRNVERLEECENYTFGIVDLISQYYIYHDPDCAFLGKYKEEYISSISRKIESICDIEGLNKKALTKDDFQVIHNRYRLDADSKMCGFVNSSIYSSVILSDYHVQSKVRNVSYERKKNASYQLELIHSLFPGTLEIPFFSHGKICDFDREKLRLDSRETPSFSNKIKTIPILGPSAKKIWKVIKRVNNHSFHRKQYIGHYSRDWLNKRIVELQKMLDVEVVEPKKFVGDIRALVYYLMYLYLLANVFGKEYSFPPSKE